MGPVEIAGVVLARATSDIEVAAQNIANLTTPGFKAHRSFNDMLISLLDPESQPAQLSSTTDFSTGKIQETGNPFDLALQGAGYFTVRSGDAIFYTRNGAFQRDAD